MTTPPTTLHERIRAELDRRLAVARAADGWTWNCESSGLLWSRKPDEPEIAITHGGVEGPRWLREYIALHDPADAIRRYEGELEVLERHAIIWRDIGWLEDGDEAYEELPVCGRCVPKHSHFPTRADVPVGACDETKGVAGRLGVSVDG